MNEPAKKLLIKIVIWSCQCSDQIQLERDTMLKSHKTGGLPSGSWQDRMPSIVSPLGLDSIKQS